MADLSDVEAALAQLAVTAIYPAGTAQPSVAGVTVTVASGWPEPQQLDGIMAAGNAMVTVFSKLGCEENTTRFVPVMTAVNGVPAAQLTLAVAGNRITVGGAIHPGEAASVLVNYQAYHHGVQAGDSFASIAGALAALIPNASASGTVITVAQAFDIAASVSVPVAMQAEIARQRKEFLISIWAATPAIRALLGASVDLYMKAAAQKRIVLPDETLARLTYRGTLETDHLAKERIYRRDLRYEVEYVTSSGELDNTVTSFSTAVVPAGGFTTTINI